MRTGMRSNPLFPDGGVDAAYAGNPMSARSMSFSGNLFSGLSVKLRVPFAEIADAATPTSSIPVGGLGMYGYTSNSSGIVSLTNISQVMLNPLFSYAVHNSTTVATAKTQSMVQATGQTMNDLTAAFGEYSVKRLVFHHEGVGLTSQLRTYIFAFGSDPCNSLTGLRAAFNTLEGQATATSPTAQVNASRSYIEQGANSVVFANWQSWSLECPVVPQWRPVYAPAVYTSVLQYGYYNTATVRDTCFGAITCMNLTGNGGGPQGRVWIEMDVEFRDPTPQSGTPVIGYRSPATYAPNAVHAPLEEIKEEKKESKELKAHYSITNGSSTTLHVSSDDDEPEVVSPPRYGTPVAVPGSGLYVPSSTPSSQKVASNKGVPSFTKTK
jgi:hypothetical protein